MCGIDWDAVLEQYRPLVERVASPDEFADLLREVLGELGTSHAYVTARPPQRGPAALPARRIGLLGANFVRRDGGWMRASASCPATPPTPRPVPRWPVRASGRARVLTHVDGRPVDPVTGPFPLLRRRAARRWS